MSLTCDPIMVMLVTLKGQLGQEESVPGEEGAYAIRFPGDAQL